MITNKYKETVEAGLYRLFAYDMLVDIFDSGLVSHTKEMWDRLVRFVAYYDPALSVYVARCEAWQIAMCQQTIPGDWDKLSFWPTGLLEDLGVLKRDNHYDWSLRDADPFLLKALHQIVRILFKYEGAARNETDLEAVKFRLSRPTTVIQDGQYHDALDLPTQDLDSIRDYLKYLVGPRSWDDLRGRFGPGASADVRMNWEKFLKAPVCTRAPGFLDLLHLVRDDTLFGGLWHKPPRSFFTYGITKVAEVPKSLKSTRVVSSEPANLMFCQLAIQDELVQMLNCIYSESVSLDDDQKHNALLRKKGFTSIDLSDASDHVSRRLVYHILPQWRKYLFSVRSTFARFPDQSICPLRTFAPMGAGDCFGVLTATVLGICGSVATRPFHVFGDDIICHCIDYNHIVERLTRCGLVVNKSKSCPSGIYRESCGLEMLQDVDVSPLLMRYNPEKIDILTLEKWLTRLEKGWDGPTIWVNLRQHILQVWLMSHPDCTVRWSRRYQRWEAKVPVYTDPNWVRHIYGEDSFRRWLTTATDNRNERPDIMETWIGPTRPSLFTWQQSLAGRSEKERNNLAGRIAERSRKNKVLQLRWRGTSEFPRFWELMGDNLISKTLNNGGLK